MLPGAVVAWFLRRNRPARPEPLTDWAGGVLSILSLSYLELRLASGPRDSVVIFGMVGLVLAAAGFLATWLVSRWRDEREAVIGTQDWTFGAVGVALVTTFLGTTALFTLSAVRIERRVQAHEPPPRAMQCTSDVLWDEVRKSFAEYQSVPGFEKQKAALEAFLTRNGGVECPELSLP